MKIKDVITESLNGIWGKEPDVLEKNCFVIKTNNLNYEGKINYEDISLRSFEYKQLSNKYIKNGDLLIEKSGGTKTHSVGYVNYYDKKDDVYTFNNFICLIRPNKDKVVPKFLFYQLRYMYEIGTFLDCFNQTTGIQNLKIKSYLEKPIVIYPIHKQSKVVDELDNIDRAISIKKNELIELDILIKSRFNEMFDGNEYKKLYLENVCVDKPKYGAQSASIPYENGRPRYIRITDINDNGSLNDDLVSSANIEDDENYKLEFGDFLFARMGATVGKTYMYEEGNQIYAGYLIKYKLNTNLINPRYLFYYTKLDEYYDWIKVNQSGAAQPGINAQKYNKLLISLPPIELQNKFDDFVKQNNKLKLIIKKQINELQELFESKMDEYFGQ